VEKYETPKLTEYGTIEQWTRQNPPIEIEVSLVIG
jgi:hypothetical protein